MKAFPQKQPTPRDLQARRIRWQTGIPGPLADVVTGLVFGEGRE